MRKRGRGFADITKGKYLVLTLILLFTIFLLVMPTRVWSQDFGARLHHEAGSAR